MRVDGYVRVSRVAGREGESFISPHVQRERIEGYAKLHGHELVRAHQDLDLPGSHSERPGLQSALSRVERGTVGGIVVARLDRFGRATLDVHRNLERIREAGGHLMTVAEGIDTATPMGRFFLAISAAFAELELERIRETWSTARERAVARGVHVASRTPTGYVAGEDGRLLPGPHAKRIAEVFAARAQGASWGDLRALMEGVPTPYGGKLWTSRSLSHVVSNRVYLGEARSGEFSLPDAHEAIVDEGVWRAAQRPTGAAPSHGNSLLAGVLRCAGCRYAMKPGLFRDRRHVLNRQYHCRGARAAGTCEDRAAVSGSVVEPWVVERFFDHIGDVRARRTTTNVKVLNEAEVATATARGELAAYRDESLISVIGQDAYMEGLRSRAATLKDAEGRLADLREADGLTSFGDSAALRETWPDLTVSEQHQILSATIDAVFLRSSGRANVPVEERAVIFWRGEGPDDLPGRGRRCEVIRPFDWPSDPDATVASG